VALILPHSGMEIRSQKAKENEKDVENRERYMT